MKHIVLVGAGHTHLHILDCWRRSPIRGAQLTCVSPYPVATYSGMLPGVLAGQFAPRAMQIDLEALCADAGARLVVASATGIDPAGRRVRIQGFDPLPYDVVSLGVGSVPSFDGVRVDDEAAVVPVKPMQTFLERLAAAVRSRDTAGTRPLRLAIVGGGAAGVELALCAPRFISRTCGARDIRCVLVTRGGILDGSQPRTVARAMGALTRRGVELRTHCRVSAVSEGTLVLEDGARVPVDVAIWVTGATATAFLRDTGLPVDDRGFLRTHATLQTVADSPVFAVGDTGSIDEVTVPKAGVHAVRQGPVLWTNLRRTLEGRPLETYTPQRSFLRLLNTGDGRAIGEWRGWSFEGRLAWQLKTWIDRRFVSRFRAL
jgi:selenide, water dikinase